MKDARKTKAQMLTEIAELRRQVAELGASDYQHKKAEEGSRKHRDQLEKLVQEQVRVLYCLHSFFRLDEEGTSLEGILRGIPGLIPPAWQYPDITCARVIFEGKEFTTANFKVTEWKQSANIKVYGMNAGAIEVYYLEARPELDEGSFSKGETTLLGVIAELLGRTIERRRAKEEKAKATAYLRREGRFKDATRPDLVLLDLNMPKKDGREVLAEIKSDDDLKRIPVVILTISKEEEDILKTYNLHANCYITKPIALEQFMKVVRAIESFWLTIVELPPHGAK